MSDRDTSPEDQFSTTSEASPSDGTSADSDATGADDSDGTSADSDATGADDSDGTSADSDATGADDSDGTDADHSNQTDADHSDANDGRSLSRLRTALGGLFDRVGADVRDRFGEALAEPLDRLRSPSLALALLAGVVVFVVSVVVFPHYSTNHDEGVYLQQAAMLLEGRIFLEPAVPDAVHPWFFVRDGDALYAKYTPVTAAVFALGKAIGGSYRVALAAVAAGNVALTVALGRHAFDHRTGLLAGGLLLASPLFLVSSSVFLSYAPATLFNLAFAYAYVRAVAANERAGTAAPRWGALAGFAIGVAFFTRPFTAVLFATPFIAHALYRTASESRATMATTAATAVVGSAWVLVALGYNAFVTGDPLTFPYEAFAPRDGLGFGTREILGYTRDYTPGLAVRANAEVVARLLVRWVPLGLAGTALAAWGAWIARDATPSTRAAEVPVRKLLAGVVASVVVGNVFFWGNLNVLGDLDALTDGLIWTLGPYYHFDVLAPVAIFAAWGSRDLVGRLQRVRGSVDDVEAAADTRRRGAMAAGAIAVVLVVAVGATAIAIPIDANMYTSEHLEPAYDVEREFDDAVLFLPQIYGDWLNHPLQGYRNDPGFDGDVVYALDRDGANFEVLDAYPDRSYYRYVYRGQWAPYAGEAIDPHVQRVEVTRGDRAGVDVSLGTPGWIERGAIELSTGEGSAVYYVDTDDDAVDARLVLEDGTARLVGPDVQARSGNGTVAVADTDSVAIAASLDGPTSAGVTYRLETPVRAGTDGEPTRVLTPRIEACVGFVQCEGGAAYVPDAADPGVSVTVDVWATDAPQNDTADSEPSANDPSSADVFAYQGRAVDPAPVGDFALPGTESTAVTPAVSRATRR
jgi:hypothetical protein